MKPQTKLIIIMKKTVVVLATAAIILTANGQGNKPEKKSYPETDYYRAQAKLNIDLLIYKITNKKR